MRVLGGGSEDLAPNYSSGYSVLGIDPSIKHSVPEWKRKRRCGTKEIPPEQWKLV